MTNTSRHQPTNTNKLTNIPCGIKDEVIPLPKLSLTSCVIVVTSLCLLCFWQAQHAGFTFDDNSAILSNKDIRSDSTPLWTIFENDFWGTKIRSNLSHKSYRPLTVLTYRMNYAFSGGYHPWGFHAVNVLLHVINCVLLLFLFSVMFDEPVAFDDNADMLRFRAPRSSMLAAVLFAVHPIHTESVVAVVGRADLISCIFFILSFLCYVQHCTSHADGKSTNSNTFSRYFICCIVCSAMAMFSKEQGITVLDFNCRKTYYMVL